jgi:myb proto-oncogene protein
MGRASCYEKVGMKKGTWTKEEDEILARYIMEHGQTTWRSLPKNAGIDPKNKRKKTKLN